MSAVSVGLNSTAHHVSVRNTVNPFNTPLKKRKTESKFENDILEQNFQQLRLVWLKRKTDSAHRRRIRYGRLLIGGNIVKLVKL